MLAKRSYFRDISGVFSSYTISLIASLLIYVVLTRVLGPEDFGIYYSIMVIPLVAVGFVQMGIRRSAVFHIGKKEFSEQRIVSCVFFLLIIASVLGMILSLAGFIIYDHPDYLPKYILIVLLVIPFKLVLLYTGGIFLGKEDIKSFNFQNWIPLILNLIFVCLFVWVAKMGIMGALLAYLVSTCIVSIYYVVTLGRKYNIILRADKEVVVSLLRTGIVFALSFVVIQLNLRVDLLILARIGDATETGLYSLAVQIVEQLWLFPSAVGVVVMSRTANTSSHENSTKETARLMRITLIGGILLATILAFLVPILVPLIFGNQFDGSSELINYLLPGVLMFMIFRVLNGQLSGMGRPGVAAIAFSFALVVNIVLNLIWIPEFGAKGAAWATNISYTTGTIGLTFAYCRICKVSARELFAFRKSDFDFFIKRIQMFNTKSDK